MSPVVWSWAPPCLMMRSLALPPAVNESPPMLGQAGVGADAALTYVTLAKRNVLHIATFFGWLSRATPLSGIAYPRAPIGIRITSIGNGQT